MELLWMPMFLNESLQWTLDTNESSCTNSHDKKSHATPDISSGGVDLGFRQFEVSRKKSKNLGFKGVKNSVTLKP